MSGIFTYRVYCLWLRKCGRNQIPSDRRRSTHSFPRHAKFRDFFVSATTFLISRLFRGDILALTAGIINRPLLAAVSTGGCNTLKAMQIAGVCHGASHKDHLYR